MFIPVIKVTISLLTFVSWLFQYTGLIAFLCSIERGFSDIYGYHLTAHEPLCPAVPHREGYSIWVVHGVPHREGYSMVDPWCAS